MGGTKPDARFPVFYQTDVLRNIQLLQQRPLDGQWERTRTWRFVYEGMRPEDCNKPKTERPFGCPYTDTFDDLNQRVLTQFIEYAVVNDVETALPKFSFDYFGKANRTSGEDGEPTGNIYYFHPRLAKISNNMGTDIRLDVQSIETTGTHYYRVNARDVIQTDGSVLSRERYAYSTERCFAQRPLERGCSGRNRGSEIFYGYRTMTTTLQDAANNDAVLRRDVTRYSFGEGGWQLVGRPVVQEVQDANGAVRRTTNTWAATATSGGAAFVGLTQQDTLDVPSNRTTREEYRYDANGNVRATLSQGFLDVSGDERSLVREYKPNLSSFMLNRVAREAIFPVITEDINHPSKESELRYTYDNAADWTAPPSGKGLPTRIERGPLGPTWVTTRFEYDALGNTTKASDANNNATTYGYDASGRFKLSETNAKGHVTRYVYFGVNAPASSNFGLLKSVTDANDATVEAIYDARGRVSKILRPYDTPQTPSAVFDYDDSQAPIKVKITQPGLSEIAFYDGLGRLIQTRYSAANANEQRVSNIEHDGLGHVIRAYAPAIEPSGEGFVRPAGWNMRPHTATRYDVLNRPLTSTQLPDNFITRFAYAANDVALLDAEGHQKISVIDGLGRLIKVREITGTQTTPNFGAADYATTHYAYDARDNLRIVTNTLGVMTTVTVDALNRKTDLTTPDMGTWRYEYDLQGNLKKQTDALGQAITFEYDALNRVVQKSGEGITSYGYDTGAFGKGRRTSASNANASMGMSYDQRGRVSGETRTMDGVSYTTLFVQDALDRITQLRLPYGEVLSLSYDGAGQARELKTTSSSQPIVGNATYNPLGQVLQLGFGNGVQTNYSYASGNYRLVRIAANKTGTPIFDRQYAYDNVANVKRITDAVNSESFAYGYDFLDRLNSVSGSLNEAYRYNEVGNLIKKAGLDLVYGDPKHTHAATQMGGNSYAYDLNGSMTVRNENGVSFAQTWDKENRLISVSGSNGVTTTCFYGPDNDLVMKRDANGITRYVGGGQEAKNAGPPQLGAPVPNGLSVKVYLPMLAKMSLNTSLQPGLNPNMPGVTTHYLFNGARVAVKDNASVTWLHNDHLGSASAASDATGAKIGEARYKPFGETRIASGTMGTDRLFAAQRLSSYGTISFPAREYSPLLGRFLSADSIVPSPNDPQSLNRYSYVRNSPLTRIDPTGHGDCNVHTTQSCLPGQDVIPISAPAAERAYRRARVSWNQIPTAHQQVMIEGGMSEGFYNDGLVGGVEDHSTEFAFDVAATVAGGRLVAKGAVWAYGAVEGVIQHVGVRLASACLQVKACVPLLLKAAESGSANASHGSTADLAKGSTLPRNLGEQLAIEAARADPLVGRVLPFPMTDARWSSTDGWVKMQLVVNQNVVHYVYNTVTGATDDFKIKIR